MAENFCGKSCETCTFKEQLSCNGCKAGPGRTFGGDCELAKCCRERGHDTCATCNQNNWCSKQRDAEKSAEIRLQKQEREQREREELEKHVPMLSKCLTVLFWLKIVALIPALMDNDMTKALPLLHRTGQILNYCLTLVMVAFCLVMAKANRRYRKAALCIGVAAVVVLALTCITGGETPTWTLLISLPALVLDFVGEYNLYTAHSEILELVDATLSAQWLKLWKWYIYLFLATIGSLFLVIILPILGLLAALAAAVGMIVIAIMELVHLYRMMDHFRTYAKNLAD